MDHEQLVNTQYLDRLIPEEHPFYDIIEDLEDFPKKAFLFVVDSCATMFEMLMGYNWNYYARRQCIEVYHPPRRLLSFFDEDALAGYYT